jgi:hypothetical protein
MFHQNIRVPGVYIFNNNADLANGMQSAPIFCTMSNMTIIAMNDDSEKALVFPKYKVIFYADINFGSSTHTLDNTNGTKCIITTYQNGALNGASSCRVYYENVEIDNVFSTTGN